MVTKPIGDEMGDEKQNDENNFVEISSKTEKPTVTRNTAENIMKSIEQIAKDGLPEFFEHISGEREKDRDLEKTKNNRAFAFSVAILAIFCLMWFTAMFMGKFEMATSIIQIILAIGAGAGIVKALKE